MAFFNTFYDLKTSTAYNTHTVGSFDANTSSGGGTFRWVKANNTSISDIPGFRIKPSGTTTGYWERIFDGPASVGWFGTINTSSQGTLASYGFTQAQLNARYGLANLVLTTDTYDTAAIKFAFYLMQEVRGFQNLIFETKDYYLTSTCYLPGMFTPTINITTGGGEPISYIIDGNACLIRDHSTLSTAIDYIGSRNPTNATQGEKWQVRKFVIKNFMMRGQGDLGIGSGTACIHVGESYSAEISHNVIQYANIGIKTRFCMNTHIAHNNIINYREDGIFVTYGSEYGGSSSSAASNHTEVFKNRLRGYPVSKKGIHIEGASGSVVDGNVWEGDSVSAGTHAVYFDNRGGTTIKECTIRSMHIERPHTAGGAFIYIRGTTGLYTIEKPYVQYAGTLVEAVSYPSGYPEIKISEIGFIPNDCKLKSDNTACWIFEHNILPAVYGITTDATMRTGVNASNNSTIWYSGYKSTSSNTVGTGSKTFTIPINAVGYTAGDPIRIEVPGTSSFMTGTVTSYTAVTGVLVVNITASGGSGTLTDWRMWTNDNCPPTAGRIIYFGSNNQGG